MASLAAIRDAAKDVLAEAVPKLRGYAAGEHIAELPAVVIAPERVEFAVAMGRGADTWTLQLLVLVATGDLAHAQLNDFVSGAGAQSIRQAIWTHRNLGLTDDDGQPDADAHIARMTAYDIAYSACDIDHVGAALQLVVHTSGTE